MLHVLVCAGIGSRVQIVLASHGVVHRRSKVTVCTVCLGQVRLYDCNSHWKNPHRRPTLRVLTLNSACVIAGTMPARLTRGRGSLSLPSQRIHIHVHFEHQPNVGVCLCCGRSRLPKGTWERPFKLTKKSGSDAQLPIAHTCFFQVWERGIEL